MSRLKNKIKKTASLDMIDIETKVYLLIEDLLIEKAKEIGWNGDIEEATLIINSKLGSHNMGAVAQTLFVALEDWAEINEKYMDK